MIIIILVILITIMLIIITIMIMETSLRPLPTASHPQTKIPLANHKICHFYWQAFVRFCGVTEGSPICYIYTLVLKIFKKFSLVKTYSSTIMGTIPIFSEEFRSHSSIKEFLGKALTSFY